MESKKRRFSEAIGLWKRLLFVALFDSSALMQSLSFRSLFHILFVRVDHFLDHLAADGTGFARCEIAVVTVLQIDADFS